MAILSPEIGHFDRAYKASVNFDKAKHLSVAAFAVFLFAHHLSWWKNGQSVRRNMLWIDDNSWFHDQALDKVGFGMTLLHPDLETGVSNNPPQQEIHFPPCQGSAFVYGQALQISVYPGPLPREQSILSTCFWFLRVRKIWYTSRKAQTSYSSWYGASLSTQVSHNHLVFVNSPVWPIEEVFPVCICLSLKLTLNKVESESESESESDGPKMVGGNLGTRPFGNETLWNESLWNEPL